MDSEDLYTALGVPKDADVEAIRKAYRGLARTHHPDKGGSPAAFQSIGRAYEILGDAAQRAKYDRARRENNVEDLETLLRSPVFVNMIKTTRGLFERLGVPGAPTGESVSAMIPVTARELCLGFTKTVKITRVKRCAPCGGLGSPDGTAMGCPACHGNGYEGSVPLFGAVVVCLGDQGACRRCRGRGQIAATSKTMCGVCRGDGFYTETVAREVQAIAGAAEAIHLWREGNDNLGSGPLNPGHVTLQIAQSPTDRPYIVAGGDLVRRVSVSVAQALIDLPTRGLDLTLPTGTRLRVRTPGPVLHNATLVLEGHGVRGVAGRGSLRLTLAVQLPAPVEPDRPVGGLTAGAFTADPPVEGLEELEPIEIVVAPQES